MGCIGEVTDGWMVDQLAVVGVTAYLGLWQRSAMVSLAGSALFTLRIVAWVCSIQWGKEGFRVVGGVIDIFLVDWVVPSAPSELLRMVVFCRPRAE